MLTSILTNKSQFQFDIRDLHFVFTGDNDQLIAEARAIANHMYRFYTNIIHRPWDEFADGKFALLVVF